MENKIMAEVKCTPMPNMRLQFKGLREEAQALSEGSKGRRVLLRAIEPTAGHPMIYLEAQGKKMGIIDKSDIEKIYDIVKSTSYNAYVYGVGEGDSIKILVEEASEPADPTLINKEEGKDAESRILSDNILPKEEMDERVAYLKTIGIKKGDPDYALILNTIKPGTSLKPETLYRVVGNKEENPLHELLVSIALGENVILEGPKSVGKNVMYETAAWIYNCRIVLMQCNGKMTKAEMFGFEATDNSAKEALTINGFKSFIELIKKIIKGFFKKEEPSDEGVDFALNLAKSMSPTLKMENGSILEALEIANSNNGVILILDEMNLAEPNTLSGAINDIADGHTPDIFVAGKGRVRINRDCFILGATQNGTGGDFVGTRKQNDATMSRFSCIKMQTPASIISLLRQMNIDGLEDDVYDTLDNIYKNYKEGVEADIYPMSCLNIRGFKSALRRISIGRPIKASVSICVNNTVPNAEDTELLDSALEDIVEGNKNKGFE